MQSLLYRLIAGLFVIGVLIALAVYLKSAGVRTPEIDRLRAEGAPLNGPEPPTLAQLRKAATDNPNSAEAQTALAKGLMRWGHYGPEAIEAFGAAIRLSPGDAELHLLRGKIYQNTGHRDQAIADYEQAASLNPQLAEAMILRGDIARYRRDLDTAISWYRQAVAAEPGNVLGHTNLGQALSQKGEHTQAIAEYEAALRTEPQNGDVMYHLGKAYRALSDTRTAREWFQRGCDLVRPHRQSCTELRRVGTIDPR